MFEALLSRHGGCDQRMGAELRLRTGAYRATSIRFLVDDTREILVESAHRCLSLLQWRLNLVGSHQPLKNGKRLQWSINGNDWNAIPGVGGAEAQWVLSYRKVTPTIHDQLSALLNASKREPLGHELLREAKQLRGNGGERSTFVVAIMAAEVGLKQ